MREGQDLGAHECEHSADRGMRIALFDDYRIGAVVPEGVVDVSDCLSGWRPSPEAINECLAELPSKRNEIKDRVHRSDPKSLDTIVLRPPVPQPRNLMGAPVNYRAHQGEVKMNRTHEAPMESDARSRGFFVMSAASIVGPSDEIQLPPIEGRDFAYEGEVAFVIGREGKGVTPEQAWDHVLGLTGFIDVTLRPSATRTEERSMRKSFESFSPLGPWILLTHEPPDTSQVHLELFVNGEIRQKAPLSDLIQTIPELVASASTVFPLTPGDVFATGTPSGVGSLTEGDTVTLHICPIGQMSLRVVERNW